MTMTSRVLSAAVVLLLVGCAPIDVRFDFDPTEDLSSLRTWNFAERTQRPSDRAAASSLVDDRVRGAVESRLGLMGYEKVTVNPDFFVAYHAAVETRIDVDTIYRQHGWSHFGGPGYGGRPGVTTETIVHEYEQGTLLIDIIEPGRKKLLWRGVARATIDRGATPEERQKRIDAAVAKLLDRFPPE